MANGTDDKVTLSGASLGRRGSNGGETQTGALSVEAKRKKALAAAIGTFELMLPTIERDTTAAQYQRVFDELAITRDLLASGDTRDAEAHLMKARHAALGRWG